MAIDCRKPFRSVHTSVIARPACAAANLRGLRWAVSNSQSPRSGRQRARHAASRKFPGILSALSLAKQSIPAAPSVTRSPIRWSTVAVKLDMVRRAREFLHEPTQARIRILRPEQRSQYRFSHPKQAVANSFVLAQQFQNAPGAHDSIAPGVPLHTAATARASDRRIRCRARLTGPRHGERTARPRHRTKTRPIAHQDSQTGDRSRPEVHPQGISYIFAAKRSHLRKPARFAPDGPS